MSARRTTHRRRSPLRALRSSAPAGLFRTSGPQTLRRPSRSRTESGSWRRSSSPRRRSAATTRLCCPGSPRTSSTPLQAPPGPPLRPPPSRPRCLRCFWPSRSDGELRDACGSRSGLPQLGAALLPLLVNCKVLCEVPHQPLDDAAACHRRLRLFTFVLRQRRQRLARRGFRCHDAPVVRPEPPLQLGRSPALERGCLEREAVPPVPACDQAGDLEDPLPSRGRLLLQLGAPAEALAERVKLGEQTRVGLGPVVLLLEADGPPQHREGPRTLPRAADR
mmetsp:Transcript_3363/g.7959  ORF Transcript_3363/g.7959 Transcript_3363/m.7959 type:complete len:278 (-) Transcript_3363:1709-2542(-)